MTENFTTYTEIDPNTRITVTSLRVEETNLSRTESAYVYKDKGTNYFDGNFQIDFTLKTVDAGAYPYPLGLVVICALTNFVGDANAWGTHSVVVYHWGTGTTYLSIQGVGPLSSAIALPQSVVFYGRLTREGTLVTLYFYNDSDRTSLFDEVSLVDSSPISARYFYAMSSFNDAQNYPAKNCYVENISISAYSGGPYISIGTINNYGDTVGPLNLPYARITDNLETILENTITALFVPWEWWIDYTGAVQVAEVRGSTKAITVSAGNEIGGSLQESSSKQSAQRVRVVGGGESATQDLNTSDWKENQAAMSTINSFYENVVGDKTVSQKSIADTWANIILAQSSGLRQEVTVRLENDPYTINDFDVGDTITVTDPATTLSGLYRIKTIDKTVNGQNGETTILTCVQNRTDVTDRLADIYKTIQKLMYSSTFMDSFMGQGGQQTKVAADTLEDVWEATSSNKWVTTLEDKDVPDPLDKFDECYESVSRQNIAWDCTNEEFYITGAVNDALGAVWVIDPLLQFSRNPRFQCEFLIDTLNGGDVWQTNDQIYFRIHAIDACGVPWATEGFGFAIHKTATNYDLDCIICDSSGTTTAAISHLSVNEKYLVEARLEWKERVVKFYFGKSDADKKDTEFGFRLRAILPIALDSEDCFDLAPFHVLISADSGNTKPKVYIYRWKTQANSSIQGV